MGTHVCGSTDHTGAQGSWSLLSLRNRGTAFRTTEIVDYEEKGKSCKRSSHLCPAASSPSPAGDSGTLSYGTFPKPTEEGALGPCLELPRRCSVGPLREPPLHRPEWHFGPPSCMDSWTECLCPLRTHMLKL